LDQTPAQMAAFQDTIFAQDAPIVCSQRPKRLPLGSGELPGPLDRVSSAYRRYLLRIGVQTGVIRA
jgi:phenylpropionate dioxygenase-like ring-hydroxylating dioxygenase large terminal subunit